MAGDCVFLGDEVSAAGFRLAGVDCPPTTDAEIPALFRDALARGGLVLITAELAGQLPAELLAGALRAQRPPILVVGDMRGRRAPPDLAAALKRQLGLAQ